MSSSPSSSGTRPSEVCTARDGTSGSGLRDVLLRFHGRIQATFISCDVHARREPIDGMR